MEIKSHNHSKFLIQYHIIFVTKYRRKIFTNTIFREWMKATMVSISNQHKFEIITQEIDPSKPDHWHGLISAPPTVSPAQIIRVLKQHSVRLAYTSFETHLRKFYWYKNLLWTRGYFCASVGNASIETIQQFFLPHLL